MQRQGQRHLQDGAPQALLTDEASHSHHPVTILLGLGTMPAPGSIEPRYRDALGRVRHVSAETMRRVQAALGESASARDAVRVVRPRQRVAFEEPADLLLESGTRESLPAARGRSRLPMDVPLGYHTVELLESGRRVPLIVAPDKCHLPAGLRIWAWAVQLYSLRSRRSWGMGDFRDLAAFAGVAQRQGSRLLLVNPLHAASPTIPQQPSPYSPTTRRYLNPLYLACESIPGARALPQITQLVAAGRTLNEQPLIDRDGIFRLKMRALQALYATFEGDPDFDAFLTAEGAALTEYATFSVLAEEFGGSWRGWPARYRSPRSADVRRYAAANAAGVRFHQWIQWHLDRQLRHAASFVPIMQDLPIGMDPQGADAWAWQDVLAEGIHVGAPPDEFNTQGQNWGLPPFIPARLKAAAYRPFVETIRGTMRHAGGLRIDHVMGLFRLYWIPEGLSPAEGAYVRNGAEDLLAIIALESVRAGAIIVGEDLGTVEPRICDQLAAANVLSYRLFWFESGGDPSRYPERALTAITTHDLPTIAGVWSGSDLEAQRRLGLNPNADGMRQMRDRLVRTTRSNERTPVREVIRRTYALLARAPSVVVTATLEDATATEARPNMPGTIAEWPNWKQPLAKGLEALSRDPQTVAIAAALGSRTRTRASRRARRRHPGKPLNGDA
jgi:4-alpha-glucanotransferase